METQDNRNIKRLFVDDREVILIGTAHVSRESTRLVQEVIAEQNPDTVCVELCHSRYQAIEQKERWQETDIIKVIKEKKSLVLLSNLLLASFQKRIAQKLDVRPGEEMIQAVESARNIGAKIVLADRDIRITLTRTWRSMGLWDRLKMLFQLLLSLVSGLDAIDEAEIERLKQEDILEVLLADVEKSLPMLRRILIDERDQYLAHRIKTAPGQKIVAVVGAGHVPGIQKHWEENNDIRSLETLPPPGRFTGLLKWGLPLLIVALFVAGFFWGGSQTGQEMLVWWILANGCIAGIGAIIALAHPFTILSSVVAAPLTSLNPMIAAGWVSGLVEAFLRKPRVIDFESLSDDILSVRGFWRNKVTRILLVVLFTNLGSAVGTFVALPMMMNLLG